MGLFVSIRRRIKFSSDRRHSSCSSVFNESNMKKNCVPILAVLAALALGSCDTPVGAGAGYGAAAGAIIGGAATGHVRGAAIGAASGAAAGALIGSAIR